MVGSVPWHLDQESSWKKRQEMWRYIIVKYPPFFSIFLIKTLPMSPALLVYNVIHRESAHLAVNPRGFWPLLSDSRGYCLPAYYHSTVRRAIFTMSFGGSKANPLYEGDPVVDALYDLMDTDGDGKLHARGSLKACYSPPHLLTWTTTRDQSPNRCT